MGGQKGPKGHGVKMLINIECGGAGEIPHKRKCSLSPLILLSIYCLNLSNSFKRDEFFRLCCFASRVCETTAMVHFLLLSMIDALSIVPRVEPSRSDPLSGVCLVYFPWG